MKFLFILIISLFSLSSQAQKTNHLYRTDTLFTIDLESNLVKDKRAEVVTLMFTEADSPKIEVNFPKGRKVFTVISRSDFLVKANGGYYSSYTVQESKSKKLIALILLFDEKNLIGVVFTTETEALGMKINLEASE